MDLHPGEAIIFRGHPSWRSILGFYIKGLLLIAVATGIGWVIGDTGGLVIGLIASTAVVVSAGLLKRMSTLYIVTDERLHIRRGIVARRVQETRLARVQNVNTDQSVLERLLQVGTVDFDTAGSDDYDFTFKGVANPEDVVRAVDHALRSGSASGP